MTDKQIIINGVDVGWCKNYNEANSKDCETLYICAENPNCYYKQLKAKEQECEELKKDVIEALKLVEITSTHNTFQESRINKLSKTLTEIKEIVGIGLVDGLHPEEYSGFLKILQAQILQKISEVAHE